MESGAVIAKRNIMIEQHLIREIVALIVEANIDVNNIDELNEYVGLLLEDIAGFELITDDELAQIQAVVLSALKKL